MNSGYCQYETDNRQQTTDNRQQTTDNRQQTTDNRQQTTDTHKERERENVGLGVYPIKSFCGSQ